MSEQLLVAGLGLGDNADAAWFLGGLALGADPSFAGTVLAASYRTRVELIGGYRTRIDLVGAYHTRVDLIGGATVAETDQDASVARGADEVLRFTIPSDVTGWTFEYTARSSKNASAAITKTSGSGISASAGATSTIDVTLTDTDTDIAPKEYAHSLWRTNDGSEKPVAEGTLTIYRTSRTA